MAIVYLPFGYPLLSGETFETLVFQGTIVRKYVINTDPRTNSQLFSRWLFADMGRTRGTLGSWGRGAVRNVLGSRWTGNFMQLVKADDGGRWTEALAALEWDGAW